VQAVRQDHDAALQHPRLDYGQTGPRI